MSDITFNRYAAVGTSAQRLAFTPVPSPTPTIGPGDFLLPFWYESDTGNLYLWDENITGWVFVAGTVAIPSSLSPFLLMGG